MKSPKVTYYEFEYCVCKLSGLVTEKPIMSFPEAGFATIEAAVYYAVKFMIITTILLYSRMINQ